MYLFFMLHQKGYPVNDLYEEKLKDIPTLRFMEFVPQLEEDAKQPGSELPLDEEGNPIPPSDISFCSQSEVPALHEGPMPQPSRPDNIKQLDLLCIPDYETSSDEEEDESSNRPWEEGDSKVYEPEH